MEAITCEINSKMSEEALHIVAMRKQAEGFETVHVWTADKSEYVLTVTNFLNSRFKAPVVKLIFRKRHGEK